MVTAHIVAPGTGSHDGTWYDLDLSAFSTGGTITVTGTPSNCSASAYLVDECFVEPAAGNFVALRNDSDVPAGTVWMFAYQFTPVTVLHLGTECNWTTPKGSTGANVMTISIAP